MMFEHFPWISLLIWLPIIGAIGTLMTGSDKNAHRARWIAVVVSVISMLICIPMYMHFDGQSYEMQFAENLSWISVVGIRYHLGLDGISFPLVLLSTFTSLIVVLAACTAIKERVAQYMATFLVLQGAMVGVFAALDSILFYLFWESMLIPMYLCIGIWGGKNRNYAAIKFFIYTFLGSALMLIALLYLRTKTGSFDILSFYGINLSDEAQLLIFLAFFLAFAVKVPMWPVHTWLPDAHTEAPAGGSVVLAALMLKMGAYGFLRFTLPILSAASGYLDWVMITLSLIAIVYIGLVAIVQTDMKKLIAYSSISHMGFVTLGCFLCYQILLTSHNVKDAHLGLEGAMVQMISHAFGSGAMFLGVGFLYDQLHTRLIKDYSGVATSMPIFAAFFLLFAMANAGLPGTSGFVGEFMVILSAFKAHFWIGLLASTTLVLGAAYTLWMYKRVFYGKPNAQTATLKDIRGTELVVYGLLALGVLAIGLYPQWLLNMMHGSVAHLVQEAVVQTSRVIY